MELVEGDVVHMSEAEAELLPGPGGVQDDEVHPHLQIRRYVDRYVDICIKQCLTSILSESELCSYYYHCHTLRIY